MRWKEARYGGDEVEGGALWSTVRVWRKGLALWRGG
jgi:hypothetical protein